MRTISKNVLCIFWLEMNAHTLHVNCSRCRVVRYCAVLFSWITMDGSDDVVLCQYLFCTAFENCCCCWCCCCYFFWIHGIVLYIAMHAELYYIYIHSTTISRVCNFHINRASERESNHYALDGKTVRQSSQSMAVRPSIKTFTLCLKDTQAFYTDKYTGG